MDVFVKDGEEYKPLSADYKVLSQSDLDSQYVPKERHGADIKAAIDERFRNHLNKDKAHEDPTVIARVLETQDGSNKVDLDKQRSQWAAANLTPVQEELKDKTEKLNAIAGKLKYAQMKDSFGSEFGNVFTDRVESDKPSLGEILVGDRLEFDLNTSSLKVKDSAMSVQDLVKELAKDPKYNPYLKAPAKNTSGHGRTGQDGGSANGGASVVATKAEVENTAAYVREFGLAKRKKEGFPSYNELK